VPFGQPMAQPCWNCGRIALSSTAARCPYPPSVWFVCDLSAHAGGPKALNLGGAGAEPLPAHLPAQPSARGSRHSECNALPLGGGRAVDFPLWLQPATGGGGGQRCWALSDVWPPFGQLGCGLARAWRRKARLLLLSATSAGCSPSDKLHPLPPRSVLADLLHPSRRRGRGRKLEMVWLKFAGAAGFGEQCGCPSVSPGLWPGEPGQRVWEIMLARSRNPFSGRPKGGVVPVIR